MKVDVRVVKQGWWPVAWGFIIFNDKVLTIKESPHNPHAYGEAREEEFPELGITLRLYENQIAEVWSLSEFKNFLLSLGEDEEEWEVAIAESAPQYVEILKLMRKGVRWWSTSYDLYL